MSGMIHTAKRLLPYAKNKVIHINEVKDPVLLRFLKDKRTLPHLREGLKAIDSQYEILIPYRVDSEEAQLKRYIQWKLGTTVNLSKLRSDHLKYYLRLYDYGSPVDVVRGWGLTPEHEHTLSEESILEALEDFKDSDGYVTGLSTKESRLYRSVRHQADKAGMSITEYLRSKGFNY